MYCSRKELGVCDDLKAAYIQGKKEQGIVNKELIKEIHDCVFQQGIKKGRTEVIDEISNEIDRLNSQGGGIDDLKFFLEQLKEYKNE